MHLFKKNPSFRLSAPVSTILLITLLLTSCSIDSPEEDSAVKITPAAGVTQALSDAEQVEQDKLLKQSKDGSKIDKVLKPNFFLDLTATPFKPAEEVVFESGHTLFGIIKTDKPGKIQIGSLLTQDYLESGYLSFAVEINTLGQYSITFTPLDGEPITVGKINVKS